MDEILYRSSADGTEQPAIFYAPPCEGPVPLLVALHTWAGNYRQEYHTECAEACIEKGWAYIHPDLFSGFTVGFIQSDGYPLGPSFRDIFGVAIFGHAIKSALTFLTVNACSHNFTRLGINKFRFC